ncbi:MAG: ATP-dependent DNA helicase RecG [Deltaproteobacteria bacterium]|nr:ATP-dependent DNA helicase RecG [Deltaproteobacteria bacterium]
MERPLRFAAKNDFANLGVVKGLESTLTELLGPPPHHGRLAELVPLVRGLDQAPPAERVTRVKRLLALLDTPGDVRSRLEAAAEAEAETETEAETAGPTPASAVGRAPRAVARAEPPPKRPRAPRAPRAPRGTATAAVDPDAGLGLLPLKAIGGVGPSTAEKLAGAGVVSALDALLWLPRRYEDRRTITPIRSLVPGEFAVVHGQVLQAAVTRAGRGKPIFEVVIGDGTGTLSLRWFRFHLDAMKKRFTRGRELTVAGTISAWGLMRQMVHPEVESTLADAPASEGQVAPVYPEIEGLRPKQLRKILQEVARRFAHRIPDPLPEALRRRRGLPDLAGAITKAHLPETLEPGEDPDRAVRRRLVYDELFFFQLLLGERQRNQRAQPGLEQRPPRPWRDIAAGMLPFVLTGAQSRVLEEIARDLAAPRPMNRLLQGDVGSGKTAVAMIAAAIVAEAGRQTALLAPTEILAEQHALTSERFLARVGLSHAILTGSTRAKERRAILEAVARHEIDVLIGTHAILEPDVALGDLGLVIVDEQHRFGVEQRAKLRTKARSGAPDVLVMTATPIPRTLALTLYGDLDVSVIDERPPGRTPITTRVLKEGDRREAFLAVERALAEGRQAYVVFPLVEASETLDIRAATEAVEEIRARFPGHPVGLLHGRLRPDEKASVMDSFRAGQTPLLVSTTVIEVGVDVPNATVMVVEHAERFGLSQIHQLRGRVGRGLHPGHCLLIVGGGSQDAWSKLAVLERTDDGFKVAEADLELRGPGELLGTRQSGIAALAMADLVRDARVLEIAREDAFEIVARDPTLSAPEHRAIAAELARRRRGALSLADVG